MAATNGTTTHSGDLMLGGIPAAAASSTDAPVITAHPVARHLVRVNPSCLPSLVSCSWHS